MPNAEIRPLGGIGYQIAFAPNCARFDRESKEDEEWLRTMVTVDHEFGAHGPNLKYAILAQKP